jgi:hypothetical protein
MQAPPGRYAVVAGRPVYELFVGPQRQERLVLRGRDADVASYLLDPRYGGIISKRGLAIVLGTDIPLLRAPVNNVTDAARLAGIGITEVRERGEYVIKPLAQSGQEINGSVHPNGSRRRRMPQGLGKVNGRYSPDPLDYPGRRSPNRTTAAVHGPREAFVRSHVRRWNKG